MGIVLYIKPGLWVVYRDYESRRCFINDSQPRRREKAHETLRRSKKQLQQWVRHLF